MQSRREFLRVALSASAAMLAAACGQSPAPSPASKTEAKPTTPPKPAEAAKPTEAAKPAAPATAAPAVKAEAPKPAAAAKPAAGPVKRGGIIREPNVGLPNLDTTAQLNGSNWALSAVYQTLLTYQADDFNDVTVVPKLAEKWTVSPDAKMVTLNLRKGVKWHNLPPVNGREFTSADVAWNAEFYAKHSGFKFLWEPVDRVETPDPYTAVIHLKTPSASFAPSLAHRSNYMYPREVFEADGDFKKRAIGTGPFMVKEIALNEKLILTRNPDYWEVSEVDGKPLPYLDGIESYTVQDANTRLAGVRSGQFHLEAATGGSTPAEAEEFSKLGGFTILEGIAVFTRDLTLRYGDQLWQDKRVRQAASLAIDRDAWIDVIYDGKGIWQDFVPVPGWGWDQPMIKQRFKRDVAKARQLLTEAGKLGAKVTFHGLRSSTAGLNAKGAELVAENLREAGFTTEIDLSPDNPSLVQTKILPGTYQTMLYVHGSNGADPDDYLAPLLSTAPPAVNYGLIKDPKLDEMIRAQQGVPDPAKRKELVDKVQEYLYEEMLLIPIAQPTIYKIRSAKLKGPNMVHGSYRAVNIERVWLDE